jgi:NADH-quinone oxidoreductase subunit J
MLTILFYCFMALAACSSLGILLSRNVFKSALFLLVCLLCVAAIYVLSFAEFVAVTQIMIYAGGILVVILFGIMLTTKISGRPLVVENTHIFSGSLAGLSIFALLVSYLPDQHSIVSDTLPAENIRIIGLRILSDYTIAFEVAGILLLIALVGAAVMTTHLKSKAL